MIDGWVWNVFRGQVVGAGTFAGRPIADTAPERFVAEMQRWGVRHLFVWTDTSRDYLAGTAVRRAMAGRPLVALRAAGRDLARRTERRPVPAQSRLLGADVALASAKAGDGRRAGELLPRMARVSSWILLSACTRATV